MKKHYEIFWHRGRGANYESELIEIKQSRLESIEFATNAFSDWGTAAHPDYVGVFWSVNEITERQNDSGEFEEVDCETILKTEVCR